MASSGKTNFKTYEAQTRLLAAVIATTNVKLDYAGKTQEPRYSLYTLPHDSPRPLIAVLCFAPLLSCLPPSRSSTRVCPDSSYIVFIRACAGSRYMQV